MKAWLKQCGPNRYLVSPRREGMRVDVIVYLNRTLFDDFAEGEAIEQLVHGAMLPGVYGRVIGMPDIHTGFGLPIGGVMATLAREGVVSAGAVGMDINCGVRLLTSSIHRRELTRELMVKLLERIEDRVPAGVGKRSRHRELTQKIEEVLLGGARRVIEWGYGYPEEQEYIEEYGCLAGADPAACSKEALNRTDQLATLGGGNHFIDIGYVAEVYDQELAEKFGLKQDYVTVMIHTGSRGFGHQICTDYSKIMVGAAKKYGIDLPSKGLACAPIDSKEGQNYLKAMACAVNFAFANRQLIAYDVRRALAEVLGRSEESLGLKTVYDVAHNIAKWEEHYGVRLLVHRKGATRALPPGHRDNPQVFLVTGHPAIIPGSMGTASFVVVGTPAAAETFFSVNHGAGRVLSRTAARKTITTADLIREMGDIVFDQRSAKKLLDEAPSAYKPIEQVVNTLAEIGITRKVVKLLPLAVLKGEDD